MPEAKTYTGGCHCGAVRYEVQADLANVMQCNCSICSKRGLMLTFAGADQFKLLSGGDLLKDYQFNKKVIHHVFCPTCGVESFANGTRPGDGAKMVAVNVRCLDGVDLDVLKPKRFDGRSV
jgi:hypothetical protein